MTVSELREILDTMPDDAEVEATQDGDSLIIVSHKDGGKILAEYPLI